MTEKLKLYYIDEHPNVTVHMPERPRPWNQGEREKSDYYHWIMANAGVNTVKLPHNASSQTRKEKRKKENLNK
jgi:hypothetical protein